MSYKDQANGHKLRPPFDGSSSELNINAGAVDRAPMYLTPNSNRASVPRCCSLTTLYRAFLMPSSVTGI